MRQNARFLRPRGPFKRLGLGFLVGAARRLNMVRYFPYSSDFSLLRIVSELESSIDV
jgi:hypothetical protein